ncbi:uncharacterized protein LOC106461251 [Limulus polyphemus]|uniref:Uncharacterized protein LOC106461251 n=1 Tax=Limulus polyphemus TaxID=6850 RepID=A0ABM1B7R4_LIMPO|nr:uncharacterized protein LOC106461251 [Limulus polyphemus]
MCSEEMANADIIKRKSYTGLGVDVLEKPTRASYPYAGQTKREDNSATGSEFTYTSEGVHSECGLPKPSLLSNIAHGFQLSEKKNMQQYQMNRNRHGTGNDSFSFSKQSVLSAMDRFVKSVKNMDATVLVPSRLKDMDINSESTEKHPLPIDLLFKTDLFSFYSMLHDVKNELLWGPSSTRVSDTSTRMIQIRSSSALGLQKPLQFEENNIALGSTGSTSDTDSLADSEMDSIGLLSHDQNVGTVGAQTARLANSFRYHLQGLQTILNQLSDSADYLSSRYQEEVGSDASV